MAVDRFGEPAEVPQAPHIKRDVQQAGMNKDRGQQPVPLAIDGIGSVVYTPVHEILPAWASQCHGDEHGDIDAENGLRDCH